MLKSCMTSPKFSEFRAKMRAEGRIVNGLKSKYKVRFDETIKMGIVERVSPEYDPWFRYDIVGDMLPENSAPIRKIYVGEDEYESRPVLIPKRYRPRVDVSAIIIKANSKEALLRSAAPDDVRYYQLAEQSRLECEKFAKIRRMVRDQDDIEALTTPAWKIHAEIMSA